MDTSNKGNGNDAAKTTVTTATATASRHLTPMDIFDGLNKIYKTGSYLDKYGTSILESAVIVFFFSCGITYFIIQNNLDKEKRDWPLNRCKPNYMPFAGLIYTPPGMTGSEYTKQNFNYCTAETTKSVYASAMTMVYQIVNQITVIFKNGLQSISMIREILNRMREALSKIIMIIFNRIMNVIIPLMFMIIKVKDFMHKLKGILVTAIYTLIGSYMTLVSLIGGIYELCIKILIALAIIIAALWALPFFGWVFALVMTIIFLLIAIPLIMVAVFSAQVIRRRGSSVPKVK